MKNENFCSDDINMRCDEVKDKLDAYLVDALEEKDKHEIDMHLKSCNNCREHMTETLQALDKLRSLPGVMPSKKYADTILTSYGRYKRISLFVIGSTFFTVFVVLWLLWSYFHYHYNSPQYHILLLEQGIWRYYNDQGAFPTDLTILTKNTKYLAQGIFQINSKQEILDTWGNPYRYHSPGSFNKSFFDLYSCGKNKIDELGWGDDVRNWHR